jgi:hypothetical protein
MSIAPMNRNSGTAVRTKLSSCPQTMEAIPARSAGCRIAMPTMPTMPSATAIQTPPSNSTSIKAR